ncbi:pre-rRNA-processing protein esf1 [Cucumis melo var. makuwa]|uniref:Pre-rRNA-processing protein esf1 n=2 Tax=Cucumis melo TaxID=3656 RepID=A0A5D3DBA6_CUCMM|nr:pre-rRNA-processing protein esf1 [Cucumis melo var. makuwa]
MGSQNLSNSKKKNKKSNKSKDERNVPSLASEQAGINNDQAKKKIITDARFSSVHSDPRFQNAPKHKAKVVIDSRFDQMFVDKRFSSSSTALDKRGRVKKGKSENPLRRYYKIEEKSDKDEDDNEEGVEVEEDNSDTVGRDVEVEKKNLRLENLDSSSELEEPESDDDDDVETEGSSYTTDTDEGDLDDIYDDVTPELPVENIPEIDKETHRLAVVNLDWRHVKAVDLYVVLSSFLPKGGQILSVAVYPSEFGLQRMKEEELHGPVGLFDDEQKKNVEDDDDDEEMDNEKLRAYEMSRLRYYYAVVECDSIATADYLYKTCDGVEFERSSNILDLRFIPDSMKFEHPPRDIATEAPSSYEVLNFHTPALQHSKIHLSWDEDEPQRVKALKRKFNADQLADLELKEFLASDESESDDESDDGENQVDKKRKKGDKYRALLQSDEDGEQDGGQDMEVTFNTGLEDISKRILEKKDKKSETLWEAHLRKKREKRMASRNKSADSSDDESSDTDREVDEVDDFFVEEPPVKESAKDRIKNIKGKEHVGVDGAAEASRAELELLLADDDGVDTGIKGYNLKHKKKKGKEDIAEDKIPTVDYNDPRFSALFNSPLFALDPTDPQFKRSAAYVRQVALKQQKGDGYQPTKSQHGKSSTKQPAAPGEDEAKGDVPVKTEGDSSKKEKYELSSLVKSIKMKSKQLQLQSGDGKIPKKDRKHRFPATEEELQPPTKNKSAKKKQRKM